MPQPSRHSQTISSQYSVVVNWGLTPHLCRTWAAKSDLHPPTLPAAFHEGCNEKINQHTLTHSHTFGSCYYKTNQKGIVIRGKWSKMFFMSQKASCALELIKISSRFVRSKNLFAWAWCQYVLNCWCLSSGGVTSSHSHCKLRTFMLPKALN